MNKKQWYAIAFWFFVVGFLFCMGTMGFQEPHNPLVECDVYYVIERLVYKLVGTLCMVASLACWLCGWFEKEDVK